jgi:hypothetical protein
MIDVTKVRGLKFASDVEAAVVRVGDTNKIKTLYPPAILFHQGVLPIIEERWDTSMDGEKIPHHIFHKMEDGSWYQDSALVETDFSPSVTAETLFKKFHTAREALEDFLRPKGFKPWFAPVAKFDASMFTDALDKNGDLYQASIAGCNPDKDAIDSAYNCETVSLDGWEYRGLGGHLHMSISPELGDYLHKHQTTIIRLLAITVGNMGVAVSDQPELEVIRKDVFGNPGRYRAKLYPNGDMGLEYRSLSASWLRTLETVERVLEAATYAVSLAVKDLPVAEELIDYYLPRSIQAVVASNRADSLDILQTLGLE